MPNGPAIAGIGAESKTGHLRAVHYALLFFPVGLTALVLWELISGKVPADWNWLLFANRREKPASYWVSVSIHAGLAAYAWVKVLQMLNENY